MKNILLGLFAFSSLAGAASPEKLAQCEWLAKVYNRCERSVRFVKAENTVYFDSLRSSAPCDDGIDMPFEERLRNSDISSTLSQKYPIGRTRWPNTKLNDSPGGIRNAEFSKAVYGASEREVERNLVQVDLLGQKVLFNKKNGAAAALAAVNNDLMAAYHANSDAALTEFLRPFITGQCRPADRCRLPGNTFLWRFVAGTTSLSNHSFGTAIDMQPESGPEYWLWDVKKLIKDGNAQFRPGADPLLKNPRDVINFSPKVPHTYPEKMVEIFEKHGFIWGGKWYRYDVMHLEFRPEFFPKLKLPCN